MIFFCEIEFQTQSIWSELLLYPIWDPECLIMSWDHRLSTRFRPLVIDSIRKCMLEIFIPVSSVVFPPYFRLRFTCVPYQTFSIQVTYYALYTASFYCYHFPWPICTQPNDSKSACSGGIQRWADGNQKKQHSFRRFPFFSSHDLSLPNPCVWMKMWFFRSCQ